MNKNKILYTLFSLIIFSQFISCGFRNSENSNYEWKLTFEDQFDTFDTTKWITHFDNGGRSIWSNKELEFYKDENVTLGNGTLKLTAKKQYVYGKDNENEKQFEYTSGMISSSFGFTQAYGKWEMKAKFPFRKGFWPAFWLVAKQRPGLPEIDIFEYFGINKEKISSAHHWGLDYPNYPGGTYEGKTAPFYYVQSNETSGNFSDVWMVWTFEC
ncbi:MAG: glycoside hydrolase family 16 protein, partial [bacterium]